MNSLEPTFLHLDNKQRTRPIYRFLSVDHLFALFETRQNVVVSPSKWDDPFENFLSRAPGAPRQNWFGQCWTKKRASDAMWRIYSPDGTAVRIRTTPTSLEVASRDPKWHVFVGSVHYPPERSLEKAFRSAGPGSSSELQWAAESLLVKRRAFRHEGEVRLLVHAPNSRSKNGLVKYAVDPHALVDQVMLDPRLSNSAASQLKKRIAAEAKFRGRIKKSLLYQPPELRWKR